jgi:hypothetical protein
MRFVAKTAARLARRRMTLDGSGTVPPGPLGPRTLNTPGWSSKTLVEEAAKKDQVPEKGLRSQIPSETPPKVVTKLVASATGQPTKPSVVIRRKYVPEDRIALMGRLNNVLASGSVRSALYNGFDEVKSVTSERLNGVERNPVAPKSGTRISVTN